MLGEGKNRAVHRSLNFVRQVLNADGTRARAVRSSMMVVIGFGGANALRLASNLVLTRLLFPEAFGLMSLVQVFISGLQMFSDLGINLSIIQNERGAEQDFLNAAWTIQIIRGFMLWLASCLLALPVSLAYSQPELARLLPVVGLNALLSGFSTTKLALVNRNLQIGVQTLTDLVSQFIALLIMISMAYSTRSIWALVVGGLCGTCFKVISQHIVLRGPGNRLHFDRSINQEIIRFGKYIFLSSIAGFLVNESDRAILGTYIPIADFGIFSIAYTLAMIPLQLAQAAGSQIIFPIYRKFLTTEGAENQAKVSKARRLVLVSTVLLCGILSLLSVPLVNHLYDNRYHSAGPILALMGYSITAQVATSNYDGAYLSQGDSRRYFFLICFQAILQVGSSIWFIAEFGLLGAIFALGATVLVGYPFKAFLAHRYQAWDPKTDFITLAVGFCLAFCASAIWRKEICMLILGN